MNKAGFNQLVSDYSKVDQNFQDLEKLVSLYPYSQPLRMLNMKSSARRSKVEFQKRLSLAAFYSTDRNVLRSLVEEGKVPSDITVKPVATKKISTPAVSKPKPAKGKVATPTTHARKVDQLRQEVLANLAELQKNKAHFLEMTEAGEIDIVKPVTKKPKKRSTTPTRKSTRSKEESSASDKSIRKSIKAKPKTSRSRSKKDEIIDKFIADKPSITPNQEPRENQSDLSKPSSVLKEDLVSENLAIIFANQGKTGKAIEIYKKLIWKFPQKKASFAARIEELKKK